MTMHLPSGSRPDSQDTGVLRKDIDSVGPDGELGHGTREIHSRLGLFVYRRKKGVEESFSDYFLAGRSLP